MDNRSQKPIHPLDQPPQPPQPIPQETTVRRVEFAQVTPFLSYGILAINVIVFLADLLLGHQLTILGAKENWSILHGELWRLFTPIFLHANFIHLGLNCYSLYIIGPRVERGFGHWRFLAIYVLSGLAGTIASFAFSPHASIGASGAIFGLIGALIPMLYMNRKVFANTSQQLTNIIVIIGLNLFYGLGRDGIDNWGHIGGLAGGLALAWFTSPRYTVRFGAMDVVRIEDESSISTAWLFYGLAAMGLATIVFLLVSLQLSPISP